MWVHVTYLFIDSFIKSCDSPDWLVHTCYQSASSRVTETKFLTQKCFSVENLIIVSLNTVIPTRLAFKKKLRTIAWHNTVIKEEFLKCFDIAFAEATLFSISCVSSSEYFCFS